MHKTKPHKGLLKRIKVTKSGKIKLHRNYARHLRSHKTGTLLRSYRKPFYAAECDVKRLYDLLSTNTRRKISRTKRQRRARLLAAAAARKD